MYYSSNVERGHVQTRVEWIQPMKRVHIFLSSHYPIAMILLLIIVFFSPFLFAGRFHLAADFLTWFYPWRYAAVGENSGACTLLQNELLHDPVVIHFPQDCLFNDMLKRGTLLLWNPFNFCGHPIQAIGHPSMVYPLRILFHYLFSPLVARELLLMLHVFLAGIFMYIFLRELALSRASSLTGAIAWMLGGFSIVYLQFENVTMLSAHLPLAFFLIERVTKTRRLCYCAGLSLTLGSAVLTGHWQYVTYGFLLIGSYVCYKTLALLKEEGFKSSASSALLLSSALVIGFATGAVQIIPSFELFSHCQRPSFPLNELFAHNRFLPENLMTLWHPDILGHPSHHFYFTRMQSGTQNYLDLCCYMGFIPLACALYAPFRRNRWTPFFLGCAIVSLLYAMGTPGITLLYYFLPGFKNFVPSRMIFIYTFCVAVLSAFGMERIEKEGLSATISKAFLFFWLIFSLGIVTFCTLLHTQEDFLKAVLVAYAPGGLFQVPNYCADRPSFITEVAASVLSHYRLSEPYLFIPILIGAYGCILFYLRSQNKITLRHFQALSIILIVFDLLYFSMKFNCTFPPDRIYPPTEATSYLQKENSTLYRVGGLIRMAHPNSLLYYRIYDVAGYAGMFPTRFSRLMSTLSGEAQPYLMCDLGEGKNYHKPMADFLNIKYHYTDPLRELPPEMGSPVYGKDIRLYENLSVLPRFYTVPNAIVEKDAEKILTQICAPDFDPLNYVYLEEEPLTNGDTMSTGDVRRSVSDTRPEIRGQVEVLHYNPHKIIAAVDCNGPTFMVSSENYYPGWEAYIDGKRTSLYRANYCFRAISLPQGHHKVTLLFNPKTFLTGLVVSLVCLVACVSIIAVSCVKKRGRT